MVTRGFASLEFAGSSSFGIKFANSSDAMPAWSMPCQLFSFQGFPTFVGHISPYRCARNFDIMKLKFSFYLAVLLNYYAYTYSFFDNIFHTVCKKTPAIYFLVCLVRSLLLTTCSLIVQTSSTIWQFLWLNGHSTEKIDAYTFYNRNELLKYPVDLELIVLTVVCYWLSILLPSPQPP